MRPNHERRMVLAIGEAVLPGGDTMPAFDDASVRRVLDYVAGEGPAAMPAFRGFLRAIDAACRVRHGRGIVAAPAARRLATLRSLYEGNAATRTLCKLGLAPLKTMHLDHPSVFRAIGCQYRPDKASRDRDRNVARQIFDGDALDGLQSLEADVVIVGSGAGGAVLAAERRPGRDAAEVYAAVRRAMDVKIFDEGIPCDASGTPRPFAARN